MTFTVRATYSMLELDGQPLDDRVFAALGQEARYVLGSVTTAVEDVADRPCVTVDAGSSTLDAAVRIRLTGEPVARRTGLWCIDQAMFVIQSPTWESARLSVRVDQWVRLPQQRHR